MGFHIIYREMKEYYRELERWSQSMQNVCEKLYQKLQKLVVSSGMQGEAAEAIRTYIGKVHFPIIKSLLWMLEELRQRFRLYIEDYEQNIDAYEDTIIYEEALQEYEQELLNRLNFLGAQHQELHRILDGISDIAYFEAPSIEGCEEAGGMLIRMLRDTGESVAAMEEKHIHDVDDMMELAEHLYQMLSGLDKDAECVSSTQRIVACVQRVSNNVAYGKVLEFCSGREAEMEDIENCLVVDPMIQGGMEIVDKSDATEAEHAKERTTILAEEEQKQLYKEFSESKLYEQYLQNLCDEELWISHGIQLSESRQKTFYCMAETLLYAGYEVTFVAGMLGNIMNEGTVGQLESSNYDKHPEMRPEYMAYMDQHFSYRQKYSGRSIMEIGIEELDKLVKALEETESIGKFGLGCIQWTGSRTQELLQCYLDVCGTDNYPTMEQCMQVESMFILQELSSETYSEIYEDWKNASSEYSPEESAEVAGQMICKRYIRPMVDTSVERGEDAAEIYEVMLGITGEEV